MKKTLKTAMTSAMFAAAIGIAAGNAPSGSAAAEQNAVPSEEQLMDATTEEMNEVYGPPSWFTEPEAGTTFEEPLREEGVAPMETETEPVQLAGEPLIETEPEPVALSGDVPIPTYDLNGDNVSNAADLTMMKRALLRNDLNFRYEYDLNYDGRFDKEDIKALRRELTGKSKEEEDAEEAAKQTSAPAATNIKTTETTTIYDIPQPDYGPVGWYE
ncbi:MAG: hypothetical protein IKQ91_05090 [Oscillospiraceae bacterium]|nr:hypothetical protein [Oscillospiraceae bacterium]